MSAQLAVLGTEGGTGEDAILGWLLLAAVLVGRRSRCTPRLSVLLVVCSVSAIPPRPANRWGSRQVGETGFPRPLGS